MRDFVEQEIDKGVSLYSAIRADKAIIDQIIANANTIVEALRKGGKLLIAGNGGSASDAQHIAGEFVSRFHYDRPGLPAIALTTDTSILTAIGNDYGYERVFSRQIQALGRIEDVFLAISTSGNSSNVLSAIMEARKIGMYVVGLTGQSGGKMKALCDSCLCMPSTETPKIQEGHILVAHIICGLVEATMFPKP